MIVILIHPSLDNNALLKVDEITEGMIHKPQQLMSKKLFHRPLITIQYRYFHIPILENNPAINFGKNSLYPPMFEYSFILNSEQHRKLCQAWRCPGQTMMMMA